MVKLQALEEVLERENLNAGCETVIKRRKDQK